MRQGFKPLPDCRTAELSDCWQVFVENRDRYLLSIQKKPDRPSNPPKNP
jgi:hypothetical protein